MPWLVRLMKIYRFGTTGRARARTGNPRLRYLAETSALALDSNVPVRSYRVLFRLLRVIPGINSFNRLYRFALVTGGS
jgi:hypothetical protein